MKNREKSHNLIARVMRSGDIDHVIRNYTPRAFGQVIHKNSRVSNHVRRGFFREYLIM